MKPPQPYTAIVFYPVEQFTGEREFAGDEYYAFINAAGKIDPEFNLWRPSGRLVDGGGSTGALVLRRVDIMKPTE